VSPASPFLPPCQQELPPQPTASPFSPTREHTSSPQTPPTVQEVPHAHPPRLVLPTHILDLSRPSLQSSPLPSPLLRHPHLHDHTPPPLSTTSSSSSSNPFFHFHPHLPTTDDPQSHIVQAQLQHQHLSSHDLLSLTDLDWEAAAAVQTYHSFTPALLDVHSASSTTSTNSSQWETHLSSPLPRETTPPLFSSTLQSQQQQQQAPHQSRSTATLVNDHLAVQTALPMIQINYEPTGQQVRRVPSANSITSMAPSPDHSLDVSQSWNSATTMTLNHDLHLNGTSSNSHNNSIPPHLAHFYYPQHQHEQHQPDSSHQPPHSASSIVQPRPVQPINQLLYSQELRMQQQAQLEMELQVEEEQRREDEEEAHHLSASYRVIPQNRRFPTEPHRLLTHLQPYYQPQTLHQMLSVNDNSSSNTTQNSPITPPNTSPIHPHFPQHRMTHPVAHALLNPTVQQAIHHSPLMLAHLHDQQQQHQFQFQLQQQQQQQYMQLGSTSHLQMRIQAQEYQLSHTTSTITTTTTANGMHKLEPRSLLTPVLE